MYKKIFCTLFTVILFLSHTFSQTNKKTSTENTIQNQQYKLIPKELYNGLKWRCVGPFRSGRTIDVAGVIQNKNIYYAAQAGGGVWKTTDGGITWSSISDSTFTSASAGAIAVAPSNENVIYVGMGEVEMRGNISFGNGVYKSIDAGKTWKHIGLNDSYAIGTIAVDPRNENVAYVAAQGHVWGPNKERGLYKTTDGGDTWKKILAGLDDTTGCVDVKLDPTNPNIIYASMWKAYRTPYSLTSGGAGSGLYKSIDGGNTWKLISENAGMPKGLMGKIIVTISSQDPNKLWASVENENAGIYFSADGGDTWTLLTQQNDLIQRPWYFSNIFVNPANDNEIYILSVEFWKSIDGGKTFNRVEGGGWDLHDMWLNPSDGNNYITGTDGGPFVTFNNGKNFSESNLPTAQFYHANIDKDFPYNIYGAQQDNSSIKIKSRTAGSSITETDWKPVGGGEAGFIVPDPKNSKITYGGEYDGIMSTFNEDNDMYRIISVDPEQHYGAGAISAKDRFNWTFPIYFSPYDNALYATSNYVHRSYDGGISWQTISPDLTRNDPKTLQPSGGKITLDNTGVEFYATIFSIAESPVTTGIFWTGSDDGLIYLSRDNGKTWNNVTPKNLPAWSMISYVEPSYFDEGTCYISATRYKSDDMRPYIFKTTDYGKTWTQITNGLPQNTYNRCVRNDPNKKGLLYCGTETGIYVSFDDGSNWQPLQLNLPVTPVVDIQINKAERDLIVATHGRSFWILDDITPLYELYDMLAKNSDKPDEIKNTKYYLFDIYDAYRIPGPGYDAAEQLSLTEGENEHVGTKVRYYLKEKPAKEFRMIFYDAKGDSIITYSDKYDKKRKPVTANEKYYENKKQAANGLLNNQPGMHEFIWDMRYPEAKGDTSATFEASLQGPLAVPGLYSVKLFVGDSLVAAKNFTIKLDPRNPASVKDLQAQFDLNKKINDKLNEIAKATENIRIIREQIQNYMKTETDSATVKTFREKSKPVLDSIKLIEETLYNPKVKAYEDNLKFPIQLEEKIAGLNYFLQMADAAPTKSMLEKYDDLNARIDVQLNKLKKIINTDVKELNKMVGERKKELIDVQ